MQGHKCKLVPNIHVMEEEKIEQQQTNTEGGEIQNQEQFTEPTEAAMCISAQALSGTSSSSTPTIIIHINGKRAVALLDAGSTSSFRMNSLPFLLVVLCCQPYPGMWQWQEEECYLLLPWSQIVP